MTIKGLIDIEQLLVWAYRDQCVDKQAALFSPRGPSAQPTGSLEQYMLLGTRVDTSSFASRALGVSAPGDAILVHDAVLALGEIWLEWRGGDEVEVWDSVRAEREGQIIEKHNGVITRLPRYNSGAEAVAPVRLEQSNIVGTIIIHAKAAARPDYYADGFSPQRGRPAADKLSHDGRGRMRRKQEGVTAEEVMHARAIYAAWHCALRVLAHDLKEGLAQFEVMGPEAPSAPWEVSTRARLTPLLCQKYSADKQL